MIEVGPVNLFWSIAGLGELVGRDCVNENLKGDKHGGMQ